MTWYSILHGPEVWLAIVAVAVGFLIFVFWEDDDDEKEVSGLLTEDET